MRQYYVYIMTNRKDGVLYTGITNNLHRRVREHKDKRVSGFTAKYNCTRLVWFEATPDVRFAIESEKRIKGWTRRKKIKLIESLNPEWHDLSEDWYDK